MSDDGKKEEEGETAAPSLEPPEPVLSAVTANREDQIQNAMAFLSHPKARICATIVEAELPAVYVERTLAMMHTCTGAGFVHRLQTVFSAKKGLDRGRGH